MIPVITDGQAQRVVRALQRHLAEISAQDEADLSASELTRQRAVARPLLQQLKSWRHLSAKERLEHCIQFLEQREARAETKHKQLNPGADLPHGAWIFHNIATNCASMRIWLVAEIVCMVPATKRVLAGEALIAGRQAQWYENVTWWSNYNRTIAIIRQVWGIADFDRAMGEKMRAVEDELGAAGLSGTDRRLWLYLHGLEHVGATAGQESHWFDYLRVAHAWYRLAVRRRREQAS